MAWRAGLWPAGRLLHTPIETALRPSKCAHRRRVTSSPSGQRFWLGGVQHQDNTWATLPNLIANCFARKSISRQRRIFSSALCKQKLTDEKTKVRSEKVRRLQQQAHASPSVTIRQMVASHHWLISKAHESNVWICVSSRIEQNYCRSNTSSVG